MNMNAARFPIKGKYYNLEKIAYLIENDRKDVAHQILVERLQLTEEEASEVLNELTEQNVSLNSEQVLIEDAPQNEEYPLVTREENSDDSRQDENAETNASDAAKAVQEPVAANEKKKNNILPILVSVIGIACGIFILVTGINVMHGDDYSSPNGYTTGSSTYTSYNWYGGDAYSGIQQAGADASNNAGLAADNVALVSSFIDGTAVMLYKGIGWILIAMGLMMTCMFLYRLVTTGRNRN